jgi:FemAB-related protein (PEP-CTERM system-associated)
MDIIRLGASEVVDEGAWDRFVRSSPDGTVFHLSAWKRVVEDVYRYTPHYLAAVEGGEIRAVLPLFELRGLIAGHVLVSVPFAVYGGLCGADADARRAIVDEARRLGERLGVRHVELRHLHRAEPGIPTKSLYVSFSRALDPDPDVNWAAIPGKQRRWIRKGIKHGLEARRGWEPLAEFYDIYARNLRRLGSPAFPRHALEAMRDHFGKEAQLLTVWHEERLVAGVLAFFFENRVLPYYGASHEDALSLGVNDFMYWELMREAGLAGYRVFDFSRSREGSGSYAFKRHWGFEPSPLAYQYVLVRGERIPNLSPSNPKLRLFIETWKRLPVPVVKWAGPGLTRWLPVD